MQTYICFKSWNRYAKRFVRPPSFSWEPVENAARYRVGVAGEFERKATWYEIETPSFDFARVWEHLPFGRIDMVTYAVDSKGREVDLPWYAGNDGLKSFIKSPGWKGGVEEPMDWMGSVRRSMAWLLAPPRDRVEPFEEGLPRHVWSASEDYYTGERHLGGIAGNLFSFPSLHFGHYIAAFLSYACALPQDPLAQEAMRQARLYGDWLLAHHHPEDYVCSGFPFSCLGRGELDENARPGQSSGERTVTLFRAASIAEALLALSQVLGEAAYADYARGIGDVLLGLQRDDGSWPFRVRPESGEIVHPYTSDVVTPARLLALLYQQTGHEPYRTARDRAVAWLLANPVQTYRWEGQYEDITEHPPFMNLQHYDVNEAIRYVLFFRDEIEGALPVALKLNEFVEDQFVIWDSGDPAIQMRCPTPAATEQYVFYLPMEAHTSLWILSLMALHTATGEREYLDKAVAAANAICRSQLVNGAFTTQGYDLRFGRPILEYLEWYGNDAIVIYTLIRLQRYLQALAQGEPWRLPLNVFVPD